MKKNITFISTFIGFLFFLISSQYLSWEYSLYDYFDYFNVDLIAQFLGELLQGLGILIFCIYLKISDKRPAINIEFGSLLSINFLLSILAMISHKQILSVGFGFLMNLSIGMLYAWYVAFIVDIVSSNYYGLSFGLGNGIACIFSYILYLIDDSHKFVSSSSCLYFYGIISVFIFFLIIKKPAGITRQKGSEDISRTDLLLYICFILLLNIVHGLGYYLPNSDTANANISIEVFRLFYAVGLVIAGFIIDRNRKTGFLLCMVALAFSSAMPLLHESEFGVYLVWIITYLTAGIISVYRTISFLDIANATGKIFWAPVGLLLGRIGYPLGEFVRASIEGNSALLLVAISLVYALSIIFAALIFVSKSTELQSSAEEVTDFHSIFVEKYGLSSREIQILDEILSLHSNKEIAASLFITEATVKFHVGNLYKKTNCKNRNELIKLYKKN